MSSVAPAAAETSHQEIAGTCGGAQGCALPRGEHAVLVRECFWRQHDWLARAFEFIVFEISTVVVCLSTLLVSSQVAIVEILWSGFELGMDKVAAATCITR